MLSFLRLVQYRQLGYMPYAISLDGASSSGRTQDFGSCRGGSNPPAPVREQGIGNREQGETETR